MIMKNIVVVTPTERESVFFVEHGIRVYRCGVGTAECAAMTAKLICDRRPELMILAGIAGTYSEDVEIGETVVVESEVTADLGRYSDGEFTKLFQKTYRASFTVPSLRKVRSNTVNTAGAIIAHPIEADIENMEGAGFFAMCQKFDIPAMEIRTISNKVGESVSSKNIEIATTRLAIELEKVLVTLCEDETCG